MIEIEYAKAIYELAVEENKVDLFLESFQAITKTYDKEFMGILSSPFIKKEQKKEMIQAVYHSLDQTFINFLNVLLDHNRFSAISGIEKEYEALVLRERNIVRVELLSAEKLSEAKLNQFKSLLALKYTGKTIEVKNTVQPELIGGVQIITNLESMDMSIKGTLNQLKESL